MLTFYVFVAHLQKAAQDNEARNNFVGETA